MQIKIIKYLLVIFALINGGKWLMHRTNSEILPLDFNTYYSATVAYFSGGNPYSANDRHLYGIATKSEFNEYEVKTDAHSTPVYAPQFVISFAPFLLLDYNNARYTQSFLNVLCLLLIAGLITLFNNQIKFQWALLCLLAFRGTWFAFDNGQPLFISFAAILSALYLNEKKDWTYIPAILLSLFSFKFTLIFAPFFYMLYRKQFATISLWIVLTLVLNLACLMASEQSLTVLLSTWKDQIDFVWINCHTPFINGLNILSTSSSSTLAYYLPGQLNIIKLGYTLLLLTALIGISIKIKRGKINSTNLLLLVTLVIMAFAQHLLYDLLVLITYGLISYRQTDSIHPITWAFVVVLLAPIGKIAELIGLPELNFIVAWIVLAAAFILWFKNNDKPKETDASLLKEI